MKRFLCLFSFLLFFMFVSASPVDFIVITSGWENVFSDNILFTYKNGYEIFVDENFQYDASDFSLEKEGTVISNGVTFDVVVHPTLGRKGRLKFTVNSIPNYKDTVDIIYNSNVVTSFESPDTTIKDATLDCGDGLIDGLQNKIIHFTNDEWETTLSDYSCDFPYRDKLGWHKGDTKVENYSDIENNDVLNQKYNVQQVTDNITYVMTVPYVSRGKIFEFTNDDIYRKIYPEGEDVSYTPFLIFTDEDITSESENETVYTKTVTRTSQVELDTLEAITKDGQKGRTYKILGSYYSTTLKRILDESTGLYSFEINEEKMGNVIVNENNIRFEVVWPNWSSTISYANMKVLDQFDYYDVAYQYSNYPGFKLSEFYYDKNETQLAVTRNNDSRGLVQTDTRKLTHHIYCESKGMPVILLYAHYDPVPLPSVKVNYNSDDSTFTIVSDDAYLSKITEVLLGSCDPASTEFYTNGSLDLSKVQTFFEKLDWVSWLSKVEPDVYKLEDETSYPLNYPNILKVSATGYDDFIQEFKLADKTPIINITSYEDNIYITSDPAGWIEKHSPWDFTTSGGISKYKISGVVSPGMRTVDLKTLVKENNLANLNNESINTISFVIHGEIKQYPVSIKLPYIEKVNDLDFKIENKEGKVYFYISSSDTEYINKLVNDKNSIVEYQTGDVPTEYFKDASVTDTKRAVIPMKAVNPKLENANTVKYDITNTDKFFSFGTHNEITITVDGYMDEVRHLADIPFTLNETPLDLKVEWKKNGDLEVSFTDDKYANKDKNIAIRFFDSYIDASGNAVSEPVLLGNPYTGFKRLGVNNFVDGWDDGYSISKNGSKTVITIPGSEFSKFKVGKQYVVQIGSSGYNVYYSKATYNCPTWEISFDLKDGKWEDGNGDKTVEVETFGTIGKLPVPIRDGYAFAGWFLDEDTEIKEGDAYSFGKDITVYAKWKTTYKTTYEFVSLSGKELKEGYVFVSVVGETVTVTPVNITGYKNLPAKQENNLPNGDKIITYVYTPEEYSITYNLDGGQLSGQKTSYNIESADYLLPIPTKEGNSFEGWHMKGLSVPIKMIGTGSTGNIELTAKWKTTEAPVVVPPKDEPKPETETKYVYISYVLDGASSNPNPDKVVQGEIINLQTPRKVGYNFQGWTDNKNNPISVLKADKDVTLIANWELAEYNYTLVSDKGDTLKTGKYTIEDEITFDKPSSILDGEYIGWYESGNPERLITGIKKGTTGNKTYYLKTAEACVIKFVSEHGSNPKDLLIKKGDKNISLPLLAEEGYEFNGWYSDSGLSNVVDSIDSENCEDITLYAGWTEVPILEKEEKVEATSPLPTTIHKSFWETLKDILLKSAIVGVVIGALAGLGVLAYNFIKANLFAIRKAFKKPKLPTKVIVMELKEVDKYKKLITLMNSKKFLKVYLADKDNIFDEIQERNPDLVLMDVFDDETITNYGLLKNNEIFTNSEAKLDIITDNGDSFEEDTFSPDSTPGELMSQMVTPLYKDALKDDDSLEYIANVVEALGVPGVPQIIKLYVKGKDIKANFDGDEFSLFEATNIVGDIADILGFEEVEEATDLIKTAKAVADTVRKEKGANAIKDALNMME